MYKYQGLLIHQSYDELGIIEVVDEGRIRSLHFGTAPKQSSIILTEPNRLYSPYSRAMMAWLLFKPAAYQILMIGLGGGVLSHYLLKHFDDCHLKVIEYRSQVVKIARSHFGLPFDARLKIKIDDGERYIRTQSELQQSKHDLIMVDAFDDQGMSSETTRLSFFDNCETLLSNNGILAINLWNSDKDLYALLQYYLRQAFNEQVLFLPVRKRDNVIAFGFKNTNDFLNYKELKARAATLEQLYNIEFPIFVRDLKTHNKHLFNRIFKP